MNRRSLLPRVGAATNDWAERARRGVLSFVTARHILDIAESHSIRLDSAAHGRGMRDALPHRRRGVIVDRSFAVVLVVVALIGLSIVQACSG